MIQFLSRVTKNTLFSGQKWWVLRSYHRRQARDTSNLYLSKPWNGHPFKAFAQLSPQQYLSLLTYWSLCLYTRGTRNLCSVFVTSTSSFSATPHRDWSSNTNGTTVYAVTVVPLANSSAALILSGDDTGLAKFQTILSLNTPKAWRSLKSWYNSHSHKIYAAYWSTTPVFWTVR